jgi:DNA-binding CsgD family transcriptional regulator
MPVPMRLPVQVDTSRMAELNAILARPRRGPKPRVAKPESVVLPKGEMEALMPSQTRLLDLLCAGYRPYESAALMKLKHSSVKQYLVRAKRATGCRTTLSLAVQYAQWRDSQQASRTVVCGTPSNAPILR